MTPGSANQAGFDEAQLEIIRERAQEWVDGTNTRALAILGARNGVVALHDARGARAPDEPDSVRLDTRFHTASLTKVVTATAVMILVERGLLGLNRFVRDYIPELTAEGADRIRVHQLLTHTSGYTDEICLPKLAEHMAANFENLDVPPLDETDDPTLASSFFCQNVEQLAFKPGARMSYCNYNYEILGELIRRASGRSYKSFVEEEIFGAIGMQRTSLGLTSDQLQHVALRGQDDPFAWFDEEVSWAPWPNAGMRANAWDLGLFLQLFLGAGTVNGVRLLSPASVQAMTSNQIPGVGYEDEQGWHDEASWGLGWGIQSLDRVPMYDGLLRSLGSFNHAGAASCMIWGDPERQLAGVYLSVARYEEETNPTPLSHSIRRHWQCDVFQDMLTAACL